MQLQLPDDLGTDDFLRDYWQKRPLLMRQGLPQYRCPLDPDDLAGLSCYAQVESRIVLEKDGDRPWEARPGPQDEKAFARLPATHWTLLVQDVEKHVPEVADLLEPFRFIPDWRLDDVMISYAADQGSVGPHIDDYDVFLIQTLGRRRWEIDTLTDPDAEYIPGLDLRILRDFNPEVSWILEPGDILYLPPNVAHWGVAERGECMTCSVGYRAPNLQEMVSAWCDELIQTQLSPDQRYRDGSLTLQSHSAQIDRTSINRVRDYLDILQGRDTWLQARWFGRFITEPKPHLQVEPAEVPLSPRSLLDEIQERGSLSRNSRSRFIFIRGDQGFDYLYAHGDEFPLASRRSGFLELISRERNMDVDVLGPWLVHQECLQLATALFNAGHFHLP